MSEGRTWALPAETDRHRALEELSTSVRRLVEATVATGHDVAVLDKVAAEIDALAEILEEQRDPDPWSARSWGPGVSDPGAFMGINPVMGRANPIAPELRLDAELGQPHLTGTVRFGLAHVGPPYRAHGGVIAAVFDQLLGLVGIAAGSPGYTASMTVTYRRPTPLGEDVRVEARFTGVEGRRSKAVATFLDADGKVTAEAEGTFMQSRTGMP